MRLIRFAKPANRAAAVSFGALAGSVIPRVGVCEPVSGSTATGWQVHSVRAALTGLRKEGKELVRVKDHGGITHYRLAASA